MQDSMDAQKRAPGQTSGSAQRPSHDLHEPITVLDLLDEAEALRREPAWAQGDRNAKTFVKEGDLRVVLTVMKQGAALREHKVPGTALIQVLSGRVRLGASGKDVELSSGRLLILERDLPHDLEAVEESAFVISIAWSAGPRGDA